MKLDLREMVTAVQLEGLITGEVDWAWRARRSTSGPRVTPAAARAVDRRAPEAHPMAGLGRQLTLNDLDGQDVIMYSPVQGRYFNELLISTFTIAGATTRYVETVTQVHTMLVLVRSASASRWCLRGGDSASRGRGVAPSALLESGRSSSTRCGAETAPIPGCCVCSRRLPRGNGRRTVSSRTWSASVHAVAWTLAAAPVSASSNRV